MSEASDGDIVSGATARKATDVTASRDEPSGREPTGPEPSVSLERLADGVGLVRLRGPRMNALSLELLEQLGDALGALEEELPGALVICGSERAFGAGADLTQLQDPGLAGLLVARVHEILVRIAAFPRAVIAAVRGYALGGGLELAMACDLRIVGESARLGLPEVSLGIIPGGGGTQRLARLVGPAKAKELIFSGRHFGADEALRIGLADRMAPDAGVIESALAWAGELEAGAVLAHAFAKRAIDTGLNSGLEDGLVLEQRLFIEALGTEDGRRGIRSFLDRGPGKAHFSGR
jgi:enoyl-CoA hydratase